MKGGNNDKLLHLKNRSIYLEKRGTESLNRMNWDNKKQQFITRKDKYFGETEMVPVKELL
jgi:hypothetical protein